MGFYLKYIFYVLGILQLTFVCLIFGEKKGKKEWMFQVQFDLRPIGKMTIDNVMDTIQKAEKTKHLPNKLLTRRDALLMARIKESTKNIDGYNQSFAPMIDVHDYN